MMVTTKEVLQRFEETVAHYIHELDLFSMEQLKQKPSDNDWSIGQMVQHLINSALYMQLRNVDQCLVPSEDSLVSQAGKTEAGAAIFAEGSFPPIRVQVPPSPNIRRSSRKAKSS